MTVAEDKAVYFVIILAFFLMGWRQGMKRSFAGLPLIVIVLWSAASAALVILFLSDMFHFYGEGEHGPIKYMGQDFPGVREVLKEAAALFVFFLIPVLVAWAGFHLRRRTSRR